MRVNLKKICVSQDGKKTCKNQGTKQCNKCAIMSGQKYHTHGVRPVLFSAQPISTLLKRLLFGG